MFGISRAVSPSFDQVVRQHERQVLRIAYRMLGNWADAEDAAQEVFFRLHKRGMKFPDETVVGAWLYRVTINLCLDRVRGVRPSGDLPELCSGETPADTILVREELKQRLMKALDQLPGKERAALVLREMEGLPTVEVAAILGSTEGTVRSQVSKAIAKLRTLLSKEEL